jgi:hypothetical protein
MGASARGAASFCSGTARFSAATPLFGGPNPVGIGVSGTFTDTRGSMNGTALVGKASQIFGATLHKLADIN